MLKGRLSIPQGATNLVVFAHRSGISCHNPSYCYLAKSINDLGCATLLIDLLAPGQSLLDDEPQSADLAPFELAERLTWVTDWAMYEPSTRHLKLTFFGDGDAFDSTLAAASMRPKRIESVVSLGGRLDHARSVFPDCGVPVLMLVGDRDHETLESNQNLIHLQPELIEQKTVPNAAKILSEPKAWDHVAQLSGQWLQSRQRPNTSNNVRITH